MQRPTSLKWSKDNSMFARQNMSMSWGKHHAYVTSLNPRTTHSELRGVSRRSLTFMVGTHLSPAWTGAVLMHSERHLSGKTAAKRKAALALFMFAAKTWHGGSWRSSWATARSAASTQQSRQGLKGALVRPLLRESKAIRL